LHRHVGVIEERAVLVHRVLVDEGLTRLDQRLADEGHAIHVQRNFETVPMHGRRFRQLVSNDEAHPVALVHLDR